MGWVEVLKADGTSAILGVDTHPGMVDICDMCNRPYDALMARHELKHVEYLHEDSLIADITVNSYQGGTEQAYMWVCDQVQPEILRWPELIGSIQRLMVGKHLLNH